MTRTNGNGLSVVDVDRELSVMDAGSIAGTGEATVLALNAGLAVQQTRSSYATAVAVQRPRTLAEVRKRLVEEARLAGEEFYYGWGVGRDKVEGPSVKLAMAAARCWGNCAVEMLPIQETNDAWVMSAVFVDLETGFTLTRQFRQSKKWQVHGKLDQERKDDVRFQIGQSKATRNVILNALPASIIDAALKEARAGVRGKIEQYIAEKGQPAACDLLLKALARLGVDESRVLARCGVPEVRGLTIEHLVALKGDLHAVQMGQERADDLFPPPGFTERLTTTLEQRAAQVRAEPTPEPAAPPAPAPKGRKKQPEPGLRGYEAVKALLQEMEITEEGYRSICEDVGVADPIVPTAAEYEKLVVYLNDMKAERAERAAIEAAP